MKNPNRRNRAIWWCTSADAFE